MTFHVVVRKTPSFRVRVLPRVIPVGGSGNILSVNGQTGAVILNADDIDDTVTAHKFATAAQLAKADGIPAGGTTGQVLAKASGTNYDFEWVEPGDDGTVTSVGLSAPTGFDVSGSPVTTSGTLTFAYSSGYQGYTTAEASKLSGIETSADVTDATNVASAGAFMKAVDDSDDVTEGSTNLFMTSSERSKLSGVEAGAEVNTVDSVNGQTGTVSLDADDIDDTSTTNKFATSGQLTKVDYLTVTASTDLDAMRSKLAGIASGATANTGTVTSVALSLPTGLSVSGSPITTSGTFTVTFTSGYSIPTTTKQGQWDTAYGWGDHGSEGYLTSVDIADINATGTPSSGTYLRGDGTWGSPSGSGDMVWASDVIDDDTFATASSSTVPTSESVKAYVDANAGGTVTSVALSAPAGFSVSGSPVTSSGTLTLSYDTGYQGYTSAEASKLSGIEASADVTDATNVAAAGAFMKSSDDSDDIDEGATNLFMTASERSKLSGIEASADVTDATNVAAAGAVMDGDFSSNGIMSRTGAGTYAVITNNSSNWNTAYGWGNHASAGYLTSAAIGVSVQAYDANTVKTTAVQTLSNKTLTDPAIDGAITEEWYDIVDAAGVEINPRNGGNQRWTLTASRTPTVNSSNFKSGDSVHLKIADGTAYTITWTTIGVVWLGGSAPTLATSGFTHVVLWRDGSTYYGKYVGDSAS